MNTFSSLHIRWLPAAAAITILVSLTAVLWPGFAGVALLAAPLASLSLLLWGLLITASEQKLTLRDVMLRPANVVTLARLVLGLLAVLLAIQPGVSVGSGLGPAGGLIAVLVCLSFIMDGLDGQAARLEARRAVRSGQPVSDLASARSVGAWLDMETDSLLFFLYSLQLVVLTTIPPVFLIVGLFRYIFGILFLLPPWNLRPRPWFSWTAKTIAAIAEVCLCGLFLIEAGFVGSALGQTAGLTAAAPGQAVVAAVPGVRWLWSACVYLPMVLLSFSFTTEALLRLREISALGSARHLAGLLNSFVVYQCIPGRQARLRRLSASFLKPGDLAIDVGAHLGNRVRAWRSMGVRVVAVEPQHSCAGVLANWFGPDPGVILFPGALGPVPGELQLRVSRAHPTLSSVSGDWVDRMSRHRDFSGICWDAAYTVPVLTLDQLIAAHGLPAFVKIDVEGFESQVLAGLSQAVPALSFEFLPQCLQPAYECLDRLEKLGTYVYNVSMVETLRFVFETWVDEDQIRSFIGGPGPRGRSGDVYARLSGV